MKIAILTQPFGWNYGGILQAYALQKVLKSVGHDVVTEKTIRHENLKTRINRIILNTFYPLCKILRPNLTLGHLLNQSNRNKLYQNTLQFVNSNIELIDSISMHIEEFDAIIVGSDQVWRPKYNDSIEYQFLGFIPKSWKGKRIAYAASFGTSEWEFSEIQTSVARNLLKKFNAVSVREKTATLLCQQKLDTKAIQVLDPTMLLDKSDYSNLCSHILKDSGIYHYFIDPEVSKLDFVKKLGNIFGLKVFTRMPAKRYEYNHDVKLNDALYSSVESWIAGFRDATYVVTDSFHGTVFSIIFEVPFLTLINNRRGASRMVDLLRKLGLENRLVSDVQNLDLQQMTKPIDWQEVRNILHKEKQASLAFLFHSLKE